MVADCDAVIVQVPIVIPVTVVPDTEHTAGVEVAYVIAAGLGEVALSEDDPPATKLAGKIVGVEIVGVALFMVIVTEPAALAPPGLIA